MGRNEPCFCGSNKKAKKCHPNIHKDSLAAKVIKSYNTIDRSILEHQHNTGKTSKCQAGCSECCYNYFIITNCEFYIILNEINNWNNDDKENLANKVKQYMNIFEFEHPDIVTYLNKDHTGSTNMLLEANNLIDKTSFPCVFLEEETQKCLIYNVRPLICRTHGNVMHITNNNLLDVRTLNTIICSKIGSYKDADWLVDIEFIAGNEHDYGYIDIGHKQLIKTKEYPLLYHLYHNLFIENLNLRIPPHYELLFFSISEDEYIRRMKNFQSHK